MREKHRYLLLFAVVPFALVAIVTALSVPQRAMAAPFVKSANQTVAQSATVGAVRSVTTPTIIFPSCGAPNDGKTWTSPTGIKYVCRYVSGAGWQWVPILGCGGAPGIALYATQRYLSPAAC
jgi:hypothetical protein